MTYRHFYDKNAAPVPGKSPVQMRVKGGPASSTVQAGVNAALNAFLAGSRISEAPNLQKTVALPDGTTVRMRSRFGQVIVDVVIPPQIEEPEKKEEFYGGIVLRPYLVSNESECLTSEPGTVEEVDFTLPEVTTDQRPAVPTRHPSDPTTHIVVQIRNNVPLDDRPVARGYVKIFRIKDPLVGLHTEVSSSPTRYLVSAKYDFSEFYLCGRKLTRVPALPETVYTIARVQSYGFGPRKFVDAATATGILFVAVNKKLYGLDAGAAEPAWVLLATAVFDDSLNYANDFGDTASKTTAPSGVTSITCSGSNGAGVCSTFTGIITPGSPRPTLSGTITLMHDGTVPEVNQDVTYEASMTIEGSNFSVAAFGHSSDIVESIVTRYDNRTRSAGAMALVTDRFLGGTLPRYTVVGSSTVENWSCTGVFDGWVDVGGGVALPDHTDSFTYERIATTLGGAAVITTNYTYDFVEQWAGTSTVVQTFSETGPDAIVRPASEVDRYAYNHRDRHTGKLAWRRGIQRSNSSTAAPAQTGPLSGEVIVPGYPGAPAGTYPAAGTSSTTFSDVSMTFELLRPNGAQVIGFANVAEIFGAVPFWAAGFVEISGAGGNKYFNLPSGRDAADRYTLTGGPTYIVQPSPLILQTGPFYEIAWNGPVGAYRYSSPPYELGIGGFIPFPGGASYAYTTVLDNTTPGSFSAVDHKAYYAPSTINEAGHTSYATDTVIMVGPYASSEPPQADSGLFCTTADSGDASRFRLDGSGLLYDIRTHGFITWSLIRTENTDGGLWVYNAVALIGNDVSVVPFRDVLDEWRNLGTPDAASNLKIMFYESPAEVSLL